jgi:hypothetical protein
MRQAGTRAQGRRDVAGRARGDGNKFLYLVSVGVVFFLCILDCFSSSYDSILDCFSSS